MLGSTRDQTQVVNRTVLASTISALLAGGGAAQAQQQQNPQGLEEITVTGSRIVRRDLEAASPIVTIDSKKFENSSTISIESVLNQMPQFVPEGTQFDQGIQAGPTLSLGIGSVNLRGIGPNRTLVLIDGRRAQPSNAALLVDTNTVPSAAIERVETITGGASAVYGADAMAGVVNFILKKDFEGVDMDFQTGATAQGDGEETKFSSLLGVNSGDGKSNVMLGVEWYNRGAVQLRDRKFFMNGWFDPGSDASGFIQMPGYSPSTAILGVGTVSSAGLPTQAAVDSIFAGVAGYVPGGVAPSGGLGTGQFVVSNRSEIYFNPDGSPFVLAGAHGYNGPFDTVNSHTPEGSGYSGVRLQPNGNLGQVSYEGQASSPLNRHSLFGRATHEINDNLTAFVQANYSGVEVTTNQASFPPAITVWSAPIPVDGRPIPAALQTLLASRPTPTNPWTLFRVLDFLGAPVTTKSTNDVFQIMAGVEGKFSNRDWTWEAYVSSGQTNTENFFNNLPSLQRYQFLLNQPNGTWGASGPAGFTSGRNYVQTCTSGLPIFSNSTSSPGYVTPDCLESIASKARALTKLKQDIGEFNLQGKLTDMKAGELRFALGASTRKNTFSFDPGETNDRESVVENPMSIFASNNTAGGTKVNEIYGELLVPVTKKFDLEFGLRESDYADSQIGTTDTSKALFTFRATNSLTLRGGFQRAERAPNTAELFQGVSLLVVPFAPSDPCSYTTTATWGNQASNPNRLAVQTLCAAIINNSDTITANDNTSVFGLPGSTAANNFARPGNPFFPLEIELRQGNPNVKPELGKTFTFGLVMQHPGKLEGLTASFDFYNIEITDAIAPLNSLFAYQQCFNANGTSNPTLSYTGSPYCALIKRNVVSGERASVDAPFINTGTLKTTGLDIATNWTKDLGKGSFYINALVTVLGKYDIQDAPGSAVVHEKDTLQTQDGGQFKYKMTNTFGYNFGGGKASIGLQWRYLPGIRDESVARTPTSNVYPVGSYQSFNLFAGYTVNDKINLRMGIDNLTDVQPLIVGARPGDNNAEVTRADYYDVLGRRAYVGVRMSF
ncbi:MAG TPA: TonB-dependent receptor [Gammaproteobacteria bacterium]|jgi:outer membrane receptor protein involved in Fe transport|nr:TonB-dependent receptor [Gammaproteobacteria bacterium]